MLSQISTKFVDNWITRLNTSQAKRFAKSGSELWCGNSMVFLNMFGRIALETHIWLCFCQVRAVICLILEILDVFCREICSKRMDSFAHLTLLCKFCKFETDAQVAMFCTGNVLTFNKHQQKDFSHQCEHPFFFHCICRNDESDKRILLSFRCSVAFIF